jgi:peptidoglycan/xylan/chitin deacetylase (PgdA/CDA1 family)
MNRNRKCLRPGRMPHRIFATLLTALIALGTLWAADARAQAGAAESAVVLVYQRFGEDNRPGNSVKLAEFDAHISQLTGGRFNIMPLPDILSAIDKGEKLANRTVAITIDDSFRSVYERAWPRLRKAGIPFTLFVSTDPADRNLAGYMTWDEIRELKAAGVTIGSHTASFRPLSETTPDGFRDDVARSLESFERELGERPTLFSWPRGEMGSVAARMLEELGFEAAFGYHSGPIHSLADRMMLPRFPMIGNYAANKEFRLRVNTLALPLINVSPVDPMLNGDPPASFSFMIDPSAGRIRGFNCFHSRQGQLELRETGDRQYEAALDSSALTGVWRINCTMPTGGKRFRWWGMQYYSTR